MPVKTFFYTCATFLFANLVYSQCNDLRNILDSESDSITKVENIASFIKTLNSSKSGEFDIGECYHDFGNRWFFEKWLKNYKQVDLDSSIYYTKKAIELKTALKPNDKVSLRKSNYNLAYFYLCNQNLFKAIEYYLAVLDLGINDLETQSSTFDLASCYEEVGDFEKARYYYQKIIDFYAQRENLDNFFLLEAHIGIINLYNRMENANLNAEKNQLISKVESILENENIIDGFQMGRFLVAKANHFFNLKDFSTASTFYKQTLETDTGFDDHAHAILINNLGICEFERGHFDNSHITVKKSIQLDSLFSPPHETLGDLYLEKKEFFKGIQQYKLAIEIALNRSNNRGSLPLKRELELALKKLDILDHLTALGKGWLEFYNFDNNPERLEQALNVFRRADELIDIIKRENTEFKSKIFWRGKSSELYTKAIETCFLLNNPEKAFYFMERNKGLLLLEDLTHEESKEIAKLPKEIAEREFNLKRAIFLSENELQEQLDILDKNSLVILKQTISNNKYSYEKFIDSLEASYPSYSKFNKKVEVLSFNDLKSNYITQNKATLHYILNDEDGYGLLTTTDTTELFQLADISRLNKEVEQLTLALSSGVSDLNNFKTISNAVFKKLFPKNVFDKLKGKQLTIIPDYTLQQIPFEALVVDANELKYLFQDVAIAYAYSTSLLEFNQQQQNESNTTFLGLAPITFDNLKLPELYFSKSELAGITEVYPGQMLLNGQASKTNFINSANDSRIIHLATHADIGKGDNPWVAFSDSKMYLKEIYATKTRADMVVLSACNTATGELKRGEGVMSLARGFFYSGAKSVVSTLWPVADESGKEILINFYKNLDKGFTKSKALQKAKLDYLKNTEEEELKHPYYWAGFVVLGDNSPVSDTPISPWLLLGVGLLGTGMLVFGYKKIKARRTAA